MFFEIKTLNFQEMFLAILKKFCKNKIKKKTKKIKNF